MSEFVRVATIDRIPKGKKLSVAANGKEILLANVEGSFYAIDNICSHQECGLDDGDLHRFVITCPCHGARYDVRNGKASAETPWGGRQDTYTVKIEGEDILVEI